MTKTSDSTKDIQKITSRLLKKADAYGVFPTPVEEIINASGLTEVEESLFDESILSKIPDFLKDKIDKLKYKVLAAIDRQEKKIYINHDHSNGNAGSLAFRRLHEVSHDIFPWQVELGYADDNSSLLPTVRNLFEKEANLGAAELLFQNDKFTNIARDYPVSFGAIFELKDLIGASIHSATRRYVETHSIPMATIVLQKQAFSDPNGSFIRNEVATSEKWKKQFPDMTKNSTRSLKISDYQFLKYAFAAQTKINKVIEGDIDCKDLNGNIRKLRIEAFNTSYKIHIIFWLPRKRLIQRAKRILVE